MNRSFIRIFFKVASTAVLSVLLFSAAFAGVNNLAFMAAANRTEIMPPLTISLNTLTLTSAQRVNYQRHDYTVVLDERDAFPPIEYFSEDSYIRTNPEARAGYLETYNKYISQIDGALQASVSMEEAAETGIRAITEILGLDMNRQTVTMLFHINSLYDYSQDTDYNSWTGTIQALDIETPLHISFSVRADTGELIHLNRMFILGQETIDDKTHNIYGYFTGRQFGGIGFNMNHFFDMEDVAEQYPETVEFILPFLQADNEYETFTRNFVETYQLIPDINSITLLQLEFPHDNIMAHFGRECAALYLVESTNGEMITIQLYVEFRTGNIEVMSAGFEVHYSFFERFNISR